MKFKFQTVAVLFTALNFFPAQAQMAGKGMGVVGPGSPQFAAIFAKLFEEQKAFTADINNEVTQAAGATITMPCKMAFLEGQSRLEIDLTQSKGSQIPPEMTAQLKAMGMGDMTVIFLPAKGLIYLVYPGLQSYAEILSPSGQIKLAAAELGKETIGGHACVKNKVTLTDAAGKGGEMTVWNASSLKKFPVRIDTADENGQIKMAFSNVKFDKPDAKLFEAPANYTRYTSMESMMQQALMKRMQGMGTMPK